MGWGLWDEAPEKKTIPRKLLRRMVWERDKGICQICHRKADPFDWELGHNRARSKGGRLTYKNTFVVHPSCNRSQQTLTLRETRRIIGGPQTETEKARSILNGLTMDQLRFLAKKHNIVVRGKTIEGLFSDVYKPPTKRQYVTALSKVIPPGKVKVELRGYVKKKPRRKPKTDDWSLW